MDSEEDSREYESIDNRAVNELFVDHLIGELGFCGGTLIDLGTGPADVPIVIARRVAEARVTGVDLGVHMLELAARKIEASGYQDRIALLNADIKATGLPTASFDFVICYGTVHHIPEPLDLFREIARLAGDRGGIFVKDLLRPDTREHLDQLVAMYTSGQTPYQIELFQNSLHASLKPQEAAALAEVAGLRDVTISVPSDRHWQLVRRQR
jgi:ubiquinone/menaquinone biosynthesis C-methylase UbiE